MRPQSMFPLTLEEHTELSRELHRTRLRLRELSAMIGAVYGPQNRTVSAFRNIAQDLQRLCAELEAQAADDLPGHPGGIYL